MIKNCLLCKNYCKHPCECEHCESYDRFKISKEGEMLYKRILSEGFSQGIQYYLQTKNKE